MHREPGNSGVLPYCSAKLFGCTSLCGVSTVRRVRNPGQCCGLLLSDCSMLSFDMTLDQHVSVVCAEARPQRSAAEVRRELQSREEARNNVKLVWRALAALASGSILSSTCACCTWAQRVQAPLSWGVTHSWTCLMPQELSMFILVGCTTNTCPHDE